MNESITRAAGGELGQELPPDEMERLIRSLGRVPWQRTTLYNDVTGDRRGAWHDARPLAPLVLTPAKRHENGTHAARRAAGRERHGRTDLRPGGRVAAEAARGAARPRSSFQSRRLMRPMTYFRISALPSA